MGRRRQTYDPLFVPKPFGEDVWIVDGEAIDFGVAGITMPFPTRMTVIRMEDGLFVHSPVALPPPLKAAIDGLGPVRCIVAPNRIHYWWVPDWHAAYPAAPVWLAPRIREQARGLIDFPCRSMPDPEGHPWEAGIATAAAPGDYMTEMVFFHRRSRTLVLTDLIENFEADRLPWWMVPLARLGGVVAPHGGTPRDMRLTYRRHTSELAALVRRMIEWNPARIVVAHGRCIEGDGPAALRRAFRWVLE